MMISHHFPEHLALPSSRAIVIIIIKFKVGVVLFRHYERAFK